MNEPRPAVLRPVILDGSNLAMQLGRKCFATRGILICARYFLSRGHRVLAFVPYFRRTQRQDNFRRPMKDQHLLQWMYDNDMLIFTPSRNVTLEDQPRRVVCYDDYYIVGYAHSTGGVVVSNDQYRDVLEDHPEWGETIQRRLIMFSWVGEMFMVAEDPLGRKGPRIDEVLRYDANAEVSKFSLEWTKEKVEQLAKAVEEVLVAPPPPPPPTPPIESRASGGDGPSASIRYQGTTSLTDLLSRAPVPRFGFIRKDNGFNHRSRRWLLNNDEALRIHKSLSTGFLPVHGGGTTSGDDSMQETRTAFGTENLAFSSKDEKLAAFQDFTGIEEMEISTRFLEHYKWHLEDAIDAALTSSCDWRKLEGLINRTGPNEGTSDTELATASESNPELASTSSSAQDSSAVDYSGFMDWFPAEGLRRTCSDDRENESPELAIAIAMSNAAEDSPDKSPVPSEPPPPLQPPTVVELQTSSVVAPDASNPSIQRPIQHPTPESNVQLREVELSQADADINKDLYADCCGIFPPDVVLKVLTEYKGIKNMQVLSNLLADELIRQSK